MSVHYKFKSTLDFDTVTFDGLHISVGDLKRAIIHQKRLGKIVDFDLQIINAQTKEEYNDDASLIPKNTSLIIARIPLAQQPKKAWDLQSDKQVQSKNNFKNDGSSLDLSKMKGSEEEKIRAMMLQSTAEYDPKSYQRTKGQYQTGEVPVTYRCNKCKKGGHWIKNCPLTSGKDHIDVKRNTGIPRSFRDKDEMAEMEMHEPLPLIEEKSQIPDELICSICNDLFTDAVMIPCCGSSFCDDCVRSALLESEDNECPDCKEKGSSPGALIPNRFLRNSVNAFKNETGYKTSQLKKESSSTVQKDNEGLTTQTNKANVNSTPSPEKTRQESKVFLKNAKSEQDSLPEKEQIEEKKNNFDSKISSHTKTSPSQEEMESDYEDNITVKMPPIQIEPQRNVFHDRSFNNRKTRQLNPPGIETSPQIISQVSPLPTQHDNYGSPLIKQHAEWEPKYDRGSDYGEMNTTDTHSLKKSGTILHQSAPLETTNLMGHYPSEIPKRQIRPINPHEMFTSGVHRPSAYHQIQNRLPPPSQVAMSQNLPMRLYENTYNPMMQRSSMGYPQYMRPPYHGTVSGYMPMRGSTGDSSNIVPVVGNLAAVYHDVAANVGTGIIDDPLEAFNRIMKEKEKRKEERYRSPDQHHFRSADIQHRGRYCTSSYELRKSRDPHSREKRLSPRRRDNRREKIKQENKYLRRRRSHSFSDRSTRSRSWSHSSIKRRSKSPFSIRRSPNRILSYDDKRSVSRGNLPHKSYQNPKNDSNSNFTHENKHYRKSHKRSLSPANLRETYPKVFKTFDDTITLEPPPPGFETNHWDDSKQHTKKTSSFTPSHESYASQEIEKCKRFISRCKDKRSRSKSSNRSLRKLTKHTHEDLQMNKSELKKSGETLCSSLKIDHDGKYDKDTNKNIKISKKQNEDSLQEYSNRDSPKNKARDEKKKRKKEKSETIHVNDEVKTHSPAIRVNIVDKLNASDKDKHDVKKDKKLKDRKKKRKDKAERKKSKRDKKDKKDREKHKNTSDSESDKAASLNSELLSQNIYADVDIKHNLGKDSNEFKSTNESNLSYQEFEGLSMANNVFNPDSLTSENEQKVEKTNCADIDKGFFCSEVKKSSIDSNSNLPLELNENERNLHEIDFDQENKNFIPSVPEPSKWEREEVIPILSYVIKEENKSIVSLNENNEKVTNEVLRKAENAIFAKAVSAIQPLEIKKTNNERHKEGKLDIISPNNSKAYCDTSINTMKSFQITIPRGSSQERSVEIKDTNKKISLSPKDIKSVKKRLGSKIVSNNSSVTVNNKVLLGKNKDRRSQSRDIEKNRQRDKEREKNCERDRDGTLKYKTDKRNNENTDKKKDHQLIFNETNYRRERKYTRNLERNRDNDHDQDRERNRNRERRDIERNLDVEQQRNRDKERARERDSEMNHERRDNDTYHGRDHQRERSERERDRERNFLKRPGPDIFRKPGKFDQNTSNAQKRTKLMSCVDTNSQKVEIKQISSKIKATDNNYIRSKSKEHAYDNKKIRDDTDTTRNSKHLNQNCINNPFNETKNKRDVRNENVHSSSACSYSDSDSESDNVKQKKKHKNKKEKKRDKRSTSRDSTSSSSKKQSRSRKKKSQKKKRKSKK